MSVRSTVVAASVFAFALVASSGAPAKRPPPPPPADQAPPTAPTNLRITATGPTSVSLAWNASADNSSNWWYCVRQDGLGCFRVNPPQTTFNVVSVTTPAATDSVPPTVPTDLRLSSESSAPEIWLDWDQSTDDTDPQSQIMYDVYLNGEPEHAAIGYGETVTYCRGEGPNTIAIRAVDTSGNASAFSNEIVFC